MATCHILTEVEPSLVKSRQSRLDAIKAVLIQVGFDIKTYGHNNTDNPIIDGSKADNLETQYGSKSGAQDYISTSLYSSLSSKVTKGDLIIVTEGWQHRCFRGMEELDKGRIHGVPVVEFWVDYPDSFAKWRVFSSRFAMANAAGFDGCWKPNWIWAPIYVPEKSINLFSLPVYDETSDAFKLEHLWNMAEGIPCLAPDWGVWAETVVSGVTGLLYRTESGKKKASDKILTMDPSKVQQWVRSNHSLRNAAAYCTSFLKNIGG